MTPHLRLGQGSYQRDIVLTRGTPRHRHRNSLWTLILWALGVVLAFWAPVACVVMR